MFKHLEIRNYLKITKLRALALVYHYLTKNKSYAKLPSHMILALVVRYMASSKL